jgi:hypothetical protein
MRLLFVVVVLLLLSGCSDKLSSFSLKDCKVSESKIEKIEDLNLDFAKCQNAANLDLVERTAEYDRWSLKHRAHVLYMQNLYTVITLLMVVVVLIFGIAFSYYELRKGKSSENNIKVSATGIEVSSKFIGIIILVVSLGFAYLFLEKAYPVVEVPTHNEQNSSNK